MNEQEIKRIIIKNLVENQKAFQVDNYGETLCLINHQRFLRNTLKSIRELFENNTPSE